MSAALSAAKKRRAPTSAPPDPIRGGSSSGSSIQPQNNQMAGQSGMQQGLSLQQTIALIDKRLIQLELFSKNISQKGIPNQEQTVDKDEIVSTVLDDFQARFDVMADEIAEMKQIVLHLQSYTMDVNKMLLNQLKNTLGDGERFTLSGDDNSSNEES